MYIAQNGDNRKVYLVIPAFRVREHILDVLRDIPSEIDMIVVIDDACPENSGELAKTCKDPRVKVVFHQENQGVGGATITGYKFALEAGADIVVKFDGDGQMDASKIHLLIQPLLQEYADYAKGNRFFDVNSLKEMPRIRILGNAVLSFMTKISSGYWNIFDPTNGFTAINSRMIPKISLEKLSKRYFFETDILFRLNLARAVVVDVSIDARYGNEKSNLKIRKIVLEFFVKHARNTWKRYIYNYLLRNTSVASFELPIGIILFVFGVIQGVIATMKITVENGSTPTGTIVLASMCILAGLQFIFAFLAYDVQNVPKR